MRRWRAPATHEVARPESQGQVEELEGLAIRLCARLVPHQQMGGAETGTVLALNRRRS